MKKTLLASAITVTTLGSVNAQADIAITEMVFGPTYAISGTLNEAGTGSMASIDLFFGHTWTATQETAFMVKGDTWSGVSGQGAYDFDDYLANLSFGQVAVGIFFDWKTSTGIAMLEIFDCVGGICSGNGVPTANGPLKGSVAIFSGTGSTLASTVPIPAAVWLMGSGLLGLVGVARRRRVTS